MDRVKRSTLSLKNSNKLVGPQIQQQFAPCRNLTTDLCPGWLGCFPEVFSQPTTSELVIRISLFAEGHQRPSFDGALRGGSRQRATPPPRQVGVLDGRA